MGHGLHRGSLLEVGQLSGVGRVLQHRQGQSGACASRPCASACGRSAPCPNTSSACSASGARPCRRRRASGRSSTSCRPRCAPNCRPSRHNWPGSRASNRRHPGEDGSERLLVRLGDGQLVESVLLPRGGLCVSTQVGCAVGCTFCMTGTTGLIRQVGSAEIVAQVALARTLPAGEEGGVHGHGRARAQPGQRDGGDRAAGHGRQHRPQEPGVLHRGRPARVRDPAQRRGQAGAGAVAAHHPGRAARTVAAARAAPDARSAGRGRRGLRPRHRLPHSIPVDAAGRHQRQRRRDSRASCACSPASTPSST